MATRPYERTMHYRPDIDGLRAVSVVTVILFHFGFSAVSGGFVGVDIFFVISGYLITSLILSDLRNGRFSFLDFYARRVRRIFPAMLAVIATTVAAGYVLALAGDYADIGRSAAYSVASLANLYFFWNTGYFDQAADLMPLLHMWSLAVEEQFYLVWPVFLVGAFALARGRVLWLLLAIAIIVVVTFVMSAVAVRADPKAAFYLAHYRAWELAIGGALALAPALPRRAWGEALPLVGLGLIAYAVFGLSKANPFPGPNALFPVVGAVLVMWPQERATLVARALSHPALVFVGKISYSLYLWHWPIYVLFRHYLVYAHPPMEHAAALLAVTFAVSYLSWRYVEQPFRHARLPRIPTLAYGLFAAALVGALGFLVVARDGFPGRIDATAQSLGSLKAMSVKECPLKGPLPELGHEGRCAFGVPWDQARTRIVLWGDSHSEHIAPILAAIAQEHDAAIVLFRVCAPMLRHDVMNAPMAGSSSMAQYCDTQNAIAVRALQKRDDIDLVILTSAWTYNLAELHAKPTDVRSQELGARLLTASLEATIDQISARGRRIALVGEVPEWRAGDPVPCALAHRTQLLRAECPSNLTRIDSAAIKEWGKSGALLEGIAARGGHTYLSMIDAMCKGPSCMTSLDGEFLYRDQGHLRQNLPPETRRALAEVMGLRRLLGAAPALEASAP